MWQETSANLHKLLAAANDHKFGQLLNIADGVIGMSLARQSLEYCWGMEDRMV